MAQTISPVEGFRNPWTQGAYAYPEADTFVAALAGLKRKRKNVMFHMPNTGEAGERTCVVCHGTLREVPLVREVSEGRTTIRTGQTNTSPDKWSTWDYDAAGKRVGNGRHYTCSWNALMLNIFTTYDNM